MYLAVLAVTDTIILIFGCGDDWLKEFNKMEVNNQVLIFSDSTCRVYPFIYNFIFHLNRWLIVCLAVEGLISVKYPNKVEKFCSLDRARAIILLLTVILVTINIHYFWSFHLEKFAETANLPGKVCYFPTYSNQHSEEFQKVIWPVLEVLVSEILPRTAVFGCAVIMAVKIAKGDYVGSKEHQAWQAKFTLDSQAINQLKVLVMVVSFVYVFFTLPKFGYLIFKYLEENNVIDIVEDSEFEISFLREALVHAIVSNLDYMYLALKFLVYFSVSRRFRRETLVLFRCFSCRRTLNFQHQKSRNSFSEPLVRETSTYNSSLAGALDHLPPTFIGNDHTVQTSLITTV